MDIIPIGFVNSFPDQSTTPDGRPLNGYPAANYANACGGTLWVAPDGTQTQMFQNCWQIAADIPKCQAMGKKILASLGGDSPGTFIASSESAKSFADFLWGSFGPLQDETMTLFPRPFGTNVVVDGFDLDIESGGQAGYADLVNELRVKFATDSSKQYYISGAPQCVVPDANMANAIQNSLFDYV
jgi:chitinase